MWKVKKITNGSKRHYFGLVNIKHRNNFGVNHKI